MIRSIYYGWWIVAACFFINLYVGGIVAFSFTAFFEPIQKEFGWSYTQISFATSLRGLEMGIFAPILGFLVDRFGSRRLLLAGTITIGFGLLLLSLTRSLTTFYASFLLLSLGAGGCTSVVTMTAVANWFQKRVGMALGLMASGFGAGGLVVPLVVGLIDQYDWRMTLVLLGFGMWLFGIPLSLIVRNRPEPDGSSRNGDSAQENLPGFDGEYRDIEIRFREAVKQRTFIFLNIIEIVRMMTVTSVVIHVMPYLSSLGIARATSGMVAAALPLVSITGRFGFGWLGDRFDKRVVIAATFLLMGAGALVFCYAHLVGFMVLFVLFFSHGFGGSMVLRGSILREYFGRASFGKMLGVVMGSGSLGGIIGPTLAGWAFDSLGTYLPVWLFLSGSIGASIWLIMHLRPIQGKPSPL